MQIRFQIIRILRCFVKLFSILPVLSYFRFRSKRPSVHSWHPPLLQNTLRLKYLLNCIQYFSEENQFCFMVTHPFWRWVFSFQAFKFIFYSRKMKTNTQKSSMFASLALSLTQCVAFHITLCIKVTGGFSRFRKKGWPCRIVVMEERSLQNSLFLQENEHLRRSF